MKRFLSIFLATLPLLLAAAACQMPFSQTTIIQTVVVQATAVQVEETPTLAPGDSPINETSAEPSPTSSLPNTGTEATDGPACTVLKNANFRKGPGTAFQPPLRALKTGTQVVPQGFQPQGFPSGSWVMVLEPGENQIGWLSLDPQLIECNIDPAGLPQVAVQPPPPPPAPVVSNSQVDGEPNGLDGTVEFSPSYLMRMKVRTQDGSQDGDGIKRVTFTISDDSGTVYQRTENNAGYCIFGGGEPTCNAWMQANGQYLWQDGQPVKNGTYNVTIEAEPSSANGDESQFGKWFFTITINYP